MSHITYLEAAVVGLIQGVSELFPVSSLGHNVLLPALIGGSWASDLNVSAASSPYLAFIVGMHVATALALLIYFWRDWVRIIGGFFSSIRHRQVQTRDQKLAWMIILATIPVGLVGVVADKPFREIFGKPVVAGVFLIINGIILYCGEKFRPRASIQADQAVAAERDRELVSAAGQPGTSRPDPGTSRPDPGTRRAPRVTRTVLPVTRTVPPRTSLAPPGTGRSRTRTRPCTSRASPATGPASPRPARPARSPVPGTGRSPATRRCARRNWPRRSRPMSGWSGSAT